MKMMCIDEAGYSSNYFLAHFEVSLSVSKQIKEYILLRKSTIVIKHAAAVHWWTLKSEQNVWVRFENEWE